MNATAENQAPLCKRCGAHHPPTFLWRGSERVWHENVPEPRSVRR